MKKINIDFKKLNYHSEPKRLRVAFICVHNSCRSQIAEALTKLLAKDIFDSYSAGTMLKKEINPDAANVIKELYNIDMTKAQRPKLISELPEMDIIITMGCNVECPLLPCKHKEDWGLDDPSGKSKDEFIKTAKIIEKKIQDLKSRFQGKELKFMKIEIYEKALCCDTGVCGTDVDTELLRITSLVTELKTKGIDIERYNLSSRPEKFISTSLILKEIQSKGVEVLPITIVNGKVIKEKVYPTNAEIEELVGTKVKEGQQNNGCGCNTNQTKNKKGCC